MGANFQTMEIEGTKTRNQVKEEFDRAQENDRYENGHSYSGGFGMARGLTFVDQTFDNSRAAAEYLENTAEKWEAAIAVTYLNSKGEPTWLIGAICAS